MPKILVVDDDIALRGIMALSLESSSYFEAVSEAGSADAAISFLEKNKDYSLVILDMGMPPNEHLPTEGIRVLTWLKQYALNTKTIVLTGQNADATSYQAILHGAFDFFSKPVEFSVLFSSLKRAEMFSVQTNKIEKQENIRKMAIEVSVGGGVKSVRNAAELKLLQCILTETEFNVHETARRMGLKRENVYYLIKKYGIERNEF